MPLVWQNGEWHLLFTRRTDKVESHQGQVSFPGGACDEGETTPEQTALREADEEIGIQAMTLKYLESDEPYYHFIFPGDSGCWSREVAECISRGRHEVARVFTIPLGWWQMNLSVAVRNSRTKRSVIAFHPFDGELLWGATARMTVDFLNVLGY